MAHPKQNLDVDEINQIDQNDIDGFMDEIFNTSQKLITSPDIVNKLNFDDMCSTSKSNIENDINIENDDDNDDNNDILTDLQNIGEKGIVDHTELNLIYAKLIEKAENKLYKRMSSYMNTVQESLLSLHSKIDNLNIKHNTTSSTHKSNKNDYTLPSPPQQSQSRRMSMPNMPNRVSIQITHPDRIHFGSNAAFNLAQQHNIKYDVIENPSGRNGKIINKDIVKYMKEQGIDSKSKNSCNGFTKSGNPCTISANFEVDGRFFCKMHINTALKEKENTKQKKQIEQIIENKIKVHSFSEFEEDDDDCSNSVCSTDSSSSSDSSNSSNSSNNNSREIINQPTQPLEYFD